MSATLNPQKIERPIHGNEYLGTWINAFTGWTVGLSGVFVVLRLITRKYLSKTRLWWDDWFITAAMTATVIGASLDGVEVHFGFGRHEYYLTAHELKFFLAYTYGEWVQTFFTLMCTKVSICFFLLRLPVDKWLIRPLQAAIVFLILSNVILTLLWILQCLPVPAVWDYNVKGRCFSQRMLWNLIFTQAIITAVSDFTFAFYPILILWNLQMRLRNKVGLCLLMGLGIITGSCCIVRTVLNDGALAKDATYGGITNWFWRLFEVQLGIIAACIPTLIPLYKWSRRRLTTRGSRKSSGFTNGILDEGPRRTYVMHKGGRVSEPNPFKKSADTGDMDPMASDDIGLASVDHVEYAEQEEGIGMGDSGDDGEGLSTIPEHAMEQGELENTHEHVTETGQFAKRNFEMELVHST